MGLEEENIFKEEAPKELVEALADHMYFGKCLLKTLINGAGLSSVVFSIHLSGVHFIP